MVEIYLYGVFAAFVVGLAKVVLTSAALTSVRTRNMAQIGMHYRILTGAYTADSPRKWQFSIFVVYLLGIAPLGSWLSVASATWWWLRWRATRPDPSSMPDDVNRLHYRLAHIAMTKAEMIVLQEDLARALSLAGPIQTAGRGDARDRLVLVLDPGVWFRELSVHPERQAMTFFQSPPDREVRSYSDYEYRFEYNQAFQRLIASRTEGDDAVEWSVLNGVVQEVEIRNRAKDSYFQDDADKSIEHLHRETTWQPIQDPIVHFFLKQMHPALFSHASVEAEIRRDMQRRVSSAERSLASARDLGFELVDDEDGVTLRYPSEWDKDERQGAEDAQVLLMQELGITFQELRKYKKTNLRLSDLLDPQ